MKWISYAALAAGLALLAGCSTPEPENTTNNTPPPAPQANANPPAEAPPASAPAGKPAESGGPPAKPEKIDPAKYKTLEGSLKYAILKPGTGAEAKDGQTALMQYTGWLTNGKKFDSSYDHGGQPFPVTVGPGGQVIEGWKKGIPGMKVGEKRQLVIPGDLAYGPGGMPPDIPPNATLIFDVELLGVKG